MVKLLFILASMMVISGCRSSILDDPTTSISYSIPGRSHVTVKVENSYSTVVATLVDADQVAGFYMVNLDASHLPEGIYFYTLEARGIDYPTYFSSTKRMLLIK
ncbi:MAG: hypothetical protein WCT99_04145 [Bacteroidota bacterium]|jgi:hypothetical protein